MVSISVHEDLKSFTSARQKLGEKNFAKATSRALNETIMQARTVGRSAVKELYNIPQRYVAGVNVNKSTSLSLTAKLYASAKPIPMDAFAPKFQTASKSIMITKRGQQKTNSFKKNKANPIAGVSIEVLKGKRETVPFAFMIHGGAARVFARGSYKGGTGFGFVQRHHRLNSSGSDIPVKPLISVTVHAAVINKHSLKKIEERVTTVFPKAIERNINHMLSVQGS